MREAFLNVCFRLKIIRVEHKKSFIGKKKTREPQCLRGSQFFRLVDIFYFFPGKIFSEIFFYLLFKITRDQNNLTDLVRQRIENMMKQWLPQNFHNRLRFVFRKRTHSQTLSRG